MSLIALARERAGKGQDVCSKRTLSDRERVSESSGTLADYSFLRARLFLLLAGCARAFPASTFGPRSDLARWVQTVYLEVIVWDSLILILICALVFLCLTRYSTRAREDQPEPPPPHFESLGLEVAWTVGPAMILLFIAVPSLRIVFRSQPTNPPPGALIVKRHRPSMVVGIHLSRRWAYTPPTRSIFRSDRPVRFLLDSDDVIHSFWIPAMGGKRDVVPGHVNELTFTPKVTGNYIGECAEFCGLSHANMRFRVFVQSPVAFDDWRANQASGPRIPRPAIWPARASRFIRPAPAPPATQSRASRRASSVPT